VKLTIGLPISILLVAFTLSAFAEAGSTPPPGTTLENAFVRYSIGTDARTICFREKAGGKDLLAPGAATACARIRKAEHTFDASRLSSAGNTWTLGFADSGVEVVLSARADQRRLEFEVLSVHGEGVDELTFLDVPLNTTGALDDPVAACALALNLKCNVPEIPGPMKHLQATCYSRFGLEGAKVAVLVAPPKDLRDLMKETVSAAKDLPHSALGGPWALDAPINRGSYLIDYAGQLGEDTADAWVQLAKNLGFGQIDFHTGTTMRFGDLAPNPKNYPHGLDGVKAVVDKLHAAGIAAGLHTYAFFVAKDSAWVSPVPDKRLAHDRVFTLADDLSADANSVAVAESTAGMSAVTGFQVRNSATLHIDDELIVYEAVQSEGAFAFTGCKRGAYGTRVAAHGKGASVEHLKECFGLFVPDGDSTLFAEVAARTAEVYNACGFDMIYLDALDGSDILAGGENYWYYGSKFVFELEKRLARPALFEMSMFCHHLWYVRSRMGAWDVPARAFKHYVDIHAQANEDCALRFLPAHLGWWGAFDWNAVQPEHTFADDIEYVCGKCIANDCGLSLLVGFSPEIWAQSANTRRLGGIIQSYESLRLSGKTPESVKALLKTPGAEFTLEHNADGRRSFRPVQYSKHTVSNRDTREWRVNNHFGAQPPRLRIETLMSAEAYDAPGGITLANAGEAAAFSDKNVQEGVLASLENVVEPPKDNPAGSPPFADFTAKSDHAERESAWALGGKTFAPTLNLSNRALGLWVNGDGQGEVLNVQLKSPAYAAGGISEHYIDIDFTGWRYCLLVEPESEGIARLGWPYSKRQAAWGGTVPFGDVVLDYNIWVDYGHIESFNLGLNNLPRGKAARCTLSPIRALPLKSIAIKNPAVTINGKTLVFPVTLESGSYIEYRSASECTLYNLQGNPAGAVVPTGEISTLAPGENTVRLAYDETPDSAPIRARVSVIGTGDAVPVD
jgi:hypothetical protein